MAEKAKKLNTDAYKGVRDFFPEDMAIENNIFNIWRNNCEKYGYEEYGASVLEPAELYKAKSGEEIVNEQTYTFIDRGDREVTLRPEMTPTVARMIAQRKRELISPIRWYSIPNLFRYEQPQRGRVREHWQLNVDIFGVESTNAEIEVINIAYDITRAYGLKDTDFEIRLNNRKVMNYVTREVFGLNEETAQKISKLIDKKNKVSAEAFEMGVKELFGTQGTEQQSSNCSKFLTLLNSKNFEEFTATLPQTKEEHVGLKEIKEVIAGLEKLGITNVRFDQTLMRGFDYYTGIVFEVFDLNPANRRSVFGGGRYDDLLSLFGNEKVPAVGFGAGDVIARDIMETYNTLPKNKALADLAIIIVGEQNTQYSMDLAQSLRAKGFRVVVDLTNKKVGDQISNASKRGIPKIICIGDEEVKNGKLRVKTLATGDETVTNESEIYKLL
ncbi:MAG: histidine--tRNA ligase [Candidatus Paceibacterota bacterium]|jgi:histidyl-tRNA synthetase